MAASTGWNLLHIDLNTAFLQGQSYDVNRDVVCQLPPEAGHPPYIAARLKKLAYGMNDLPDAGGTSLTRHCVAMAWFPRELIDATTCCIRHSRVSEPGTKGTTHSGMIQATSQLKRVCGQKQMLHMRKYWIPLQ